MYWDKIGRIVPPSYQSEDIDTVRAVTPGGRLGRKLENEDLTMSDVGSVPEETFVKLVSWGGPKADLENHQDQARKVWSYAADVMRLTGME